MILSSVHLFLPAIQKRKSQKENRLGFINGQMIVGAVTQETLEEIIKEELKKN